MPLTLVNRIDSTPGALCPAVDREGLSSPLFLLQLCDRSDVNNNKNTSSITCKYYATHFAYIVPHSYNSQEVAQGHVTKRRRSQDPNRSSGFRGEPLGTLHAYSLPAANRQGMTGSLTLAVRANLWNDLQAPQPWVGSVQITALFIHCCHGRALSDLSPQVSWAGQRKHSWEEHNKALKPFRGPSPLHFKPKRWMRRKNAAPWA